MLSAMKSPRPAPLAFTLIVWLAAVAVASAQPPGDLAAPEGPAPTVDGLIDMGAQEWLINNCANQWSADGSFSLCAVHDCATLYVMMTTSFYHPERAPLFIVFDADRDGQAFTAGDVAITSERGFVVYADGGAPQTDTDTQGRYAVDVQPETGELQLEAAIPLAELGLTPGGEVPYAFGQAPPPVTDVPLSTLSLDVCGGPTPEVATPAPWPTEVTFEVFLEQQRAEQAAREAEQRTQALVAVAPWLVLAILLIGAAALRRWRRRAN